VVWQQQYTTDHPYGINDGGMILARGYETQFSAGVYAKIGPLSIQLRPEVVYAENKDFRKLSEVYVSPTFNSDAYSYYHARIDQPERFGNGSYSKASWGQSSIRLTFDPVSIGVSNENLWWGPGVRNSLLMSNNASGFKHITLNTSKPVKTYIGDFEAQLVGGRLDLSGIATPSGLTVPVKDDWRYFSGLILTWQPKWVKGLYLGFDRSFIVNRQNMGNSIGDYLPIFSPVEKVSFGAPDEASGLNSDDVKNRDQYISAFARWVMPESHAEVYFEYGRNDHAYNLRDALTEPEHSRAYIVGIRKLVPLKRADEYIQVGIEFTQMEGSPTGVNRSQPTWYQHFLVQGGYTQEGQVLGAGIGPGSNLQSLDVSWVKGLKKIGFQFERQVQNNDLFYAAINSIRSHWIDLSFAGKFAWNYKQFVLNGQFTYIRSLNYQYQLKEADSFWDWNKQDADNLQLKVGLLYNFK